jgi:hypothetical protein
MSSAVRSIVEIYVSLKDRKAIEELRDHRHKLRSRVADKSSGWFDTSYLMGLIDEDLRAIEAGLDRL